jgi:signal transduction histidine kinase
MNPFHRPRPQPGLARLGATLATVRAGTLARVRAVAARFRARGPADAAAGAPKAATPDLIAARRLNALQSLATELAGALTTTQVIDLVIGNGVEALRSDGAAVYLLERDGQSIRAVAWRGHPDENARGVGPLALDLHLPTTDVARTGAPVFIEDPTHYLAEYGATFTSLGIDARPVAVAAVPLTANRQRFGVLSFTWSRGHTLEPDRQAFIAALARLGASAIERGRLFDAEREALHRAESAQRRLDLLAEAGRVLGMSLDFEDIVWRLARVAVPLMGDVCIVDVLGELSKRQLVATADPAMGDDAALEAGLLAVPAGQGAIARVVREGTSGMFEVDPADNHGNHPPLRWGLGVPIQIRDRTIGALVYLRRGDHPYDDEALVVAEELGHRAGRALDNARLHGEIARLAARERRHAAELEAVIAALGEAIVVANPDGSVRLSNSAATRLLGGIPQTVDEILDRMLDAGDARPSSLERGPAEYRLAANPTAWVEIAAYPVADMGAVIPTSSVIVGRDVTAFRQGQGLREAFLGLLSHELRTPVTSIYAGASMLLRPSVATDGGLRDEVLADIAGEAERLYRLVEDLLVLARFDEGFDLGDQPILLQRIVPSVVDQERDRWPGVTFEVDIAADLPAVGGDETSIAQVLRNLLSNAAKYGGVGATVLTIVEPADGGVAVRVRDQGPGIDAQELETIFDPFFRSPSTARMAGGAGIGLYVSRRLVGAMNGRIWAAPGPDGGSELSFLLPRYELEGDE